MNYLCNKQNNNTMAKKFDVLSPDGFSIDFEDTYHTIEQAEQAFKEWAKRYEKQGYYSSANGRIPLDELMGYCRIIEIEVDEN
jgi:hypothetical protein